MITSTAQSVPNSGRSFSRRARPDDLGLAQSVEDLAVEQLIAKAGVEALDVAILPRAAPLDVSGLGTDSRDPFLHGLGDELRSVVGPDVSGNAPQDEEVGQNVDHIDCLELAGDTDRQAFMAELVENVEHPVFASIMGAVLDKVVGPDMIAVLRPQPNARDPSAAPQARRQRGLRAEKNVGPGATNNAWAPVPTRCADTASSFLMSGTSSRSAAEQRARRLAFRP